jgi:hypothetical protein
MTFRAVVVKARTHARVQAVFAKLAPVDGDQP